MRRRTFLAGSLLLLTDAAEAAVESTDYPAVRPAVALSFPRDYGSHPAFRTEWWYITGWVKTREGEELGLQITFFRSRPGIGETNPSRFAPRQLLFAHAALSDARIGRLLHDQRAAREGFGLAAASERDTDVKIDDWRLARSGEAYEARIVGRDFGYALRFAPTQGLLIQGERGYSRKGPRARQASYYYSQPHLEVTGSITRQDKKTELASGRAWLDHEWSSEVMAAETAGWDWVGLNLADGGALMAFRMRDKNGGIYWAGGTHRSADGRVRVFRPEEIAFDPLRRWRSPRTQAEYPVSMRIKAGETELTLEPSMDDQELDSRSSTGVIYWEGAVRAREGGRLAGQGYLELTGYGKPVRL
jgi:predicted secreted hydrolase